MEINWITDVVVPLGSALIGGTLALIGVLITLSREKKELKNERIEKAKPVLINYPDDTIDRSKLMPSFVFKASEGDTRGTLTGVFKNTDNGIAFIDCVKTETKVYTPVNNATIDKNTIFYIRLANIAGETMKECNILCHDIYGTEYCYKAHFDCKAASRSDIVIDSMKRIGK